jgi:hypothetical protein
MQATLSANVEPQTKILTDNILDRPHWNLGGSSNFTLTFFWLILHLTFLTRVRVWAVFRLPRSCCPFNFAPLFTNVD